MLGLASCGKSAIGSGVAGDPCTANADCVVPLICLGGQCSELVPCSGGATRCNDREVEECTRGAWVSREDCMESGCSAGACRQCNTQGDVRCAMDESGDQLVCSADGQWVYRRTCDAGCDGATGACTPAVCAPFTRRCVGDASGTNVEVCDQRGTAFVSEGPCDAGMVCQAGSCIPEPPAACVDGVDRCNGSSVEHCMTGTWQFTEACSTVCISGACTSCVPGLRRCGASGPEVCNADGSAWTAEVCASGCVGDGVCPDCTPGTRQCSGDAVEVCSADGSGFIPVAFCSTTCASGSCTSPVCSPGITQCTADALGTETCNVRGTGFDAAASCPTRCEGGRCVECTPGARRCSAAADTVEVCNGDGIWVYGFACPTGCDGSASPIACMDPICAPLSRRCDPSRPLEVQLCNSTGSGWVDVETCSSTCTAGTCGGAVICVLGDRRCTAGGDVERCNPTGTAWVYEESCLTTCRGGTCAGASCRPFTLAATPTHVVADANSTLLVSTPTAISSRLDDPVPDGTLFTVVVSGAPSRVTLGDADPSTPAIEVASLAGLLDFGVGSSALTAGTVTVTATEVNHPSCTGTVDITLDSGGSSFAAAADLTTISAIDTSATTATVDTVLGFSGVTLTNDFGTGSDGDLILTSGAGTVDLSLTTAVAYPVNSISSSSVRVAADPVGIAVGDEVVLINQQGGPGATNSVGAHETFRVAVNDIVSRQITFTNPISVLFGEIANANIAGQHIVLQRVPQYRRVDVQASTVLTTQAWDGSKGGLLFLRASQAITISGSVSMAGKGYRGGASNIHQGESITGVGTTGPAANMGGGGGANNGVCNNGGGGGGAGYGAAGQVGRTNWSAGGAGGAVYGDALLSAWDMGSGGGGPTNCITTGVGTAGGGMIVLFSPSITIGGPIDAGGGNATAWLGAGSGGAIYLSALSLAAGSGLVRAPGGFENGAAGVGSGGVGRIRFDYPTGQLTGESVPPHRLGGAPSGLLLQSLAVDSVSSGISSATLVQAIEDAAGGSISYELSNDGGATWAAAGVGIPFNFAVATASDLRWRARFTRTAGSLLPVRLHGLVLTYTTP